MVGWFPFNYYYYNTDKYNKAIGIRIFIMYKVPNFFMLGDS